MRMSTIPGHIAAGLMAGYLVVAALCVLGLVSLG